MFGAIFFGIIAFVVWAYITVLKLVVTAVWWVASRLFKLDRRTNLPGSKPVGFYVGRVMARFNRGRAQRWRQERERETLKRYPHTESAWSQEDETELARAFRAGESINSIAQRVGRSPSTIAGHARAMDLMSIREFNNYVRQAAGPG